MLEKRGWDGEWRKSEASGVEVRSREWLSQAGTVDGAWCL